MTFEWMRSLVAVTAVTAAVPAMAHAEDLSRVAGMKVPDPFMGLVAVAKPMAPAWCKSVKDPTARGRDGNALGRTLEGMDGD